LPCRLKCGILETGAYRENHPPHPLEDTYLKKQLKYEGFSPGVIEAFQEEET
jgi:hypothetical protein